MERKTLIPGRRPLTWSAPLLFAAALLVCCTPGNKPERAESLNAFFPDKNLHHQFINLRDSLMKHARRINQMKSPSQSDIQEYFARRKKLDSLNREILGERFTIDTTPHGLRMSYFNFVDYAIRTGHAGLEYKEEKYGFSWDEIVSYYRRKIAASGSDEAFLHLCDEMVGVLDDAHTYIGYRHNEMLRSLPADVRPRDGRWVLMSFPPGFPSAQAAPGDELLSVDGKNPGELWDELLPLTVYGRYKGMEELFERRFLRTYYFHRVHPEGLDSSRLQFRKDNGAVYEVELPWRPVRAVRNMYGARVHNGPKKGISGHRQPETGYGYIKIDTWNPDFRETYDSLFHSLKDCPAMILDVRNNFGGDYTHFGQQVLASFHSGDRITLYKKFRNAPLYHLYGFDGLHYQNDTSWRTSYYPPVPVECQAPAPSWDKPVVLLVNGKHFSSNDLFLIAWHEWNTGPVIGRMNDFQLSGQPVRIPTPWNGWIMGLSVMVPLSGQQKLYEDRQIPLTMTVPLTRQEILGESDPILDSAIVFLNNQWKKQ